MPDSQHVLGGAEGPISALHVFMILDPTTAVGREIIDSFYQIQFGEKIISISIVPALLQQ